MTPHQYIDLAIIPALTALVPERMNTREAWVMMLAIALQESNLRGRVQGENIATTGPYPASKKGGPARGPHQFELIGVEEVCRHPASAGHMRQACATLGYRFNAADLHTAMRWDLALDCTIARLALWRHPAPLPAATERKVAWAQYVEIWRPGAERPDDWPVNWTAALAVTAGRRP